MMRCMTSRIESLEKQVVALSEEARKHPIAGVEEFVPSGPCPEPNLEEE